MTQQQRVQVREKIIIELGFVDKEVKELQVLCQPISPECALGNLARFELMNDQVLSKKTLYQVQIRKNRLDYALSKVSKEDFGLCMGCDEEIAFERLILLPESTHCIECSAR